MQDQLCTALVNFEIDLVLSTGMPDMESVAEVSGCGWNERASVVAAAHHPIVRLPSPTLDTLISLPWAFMPKGTAPYARWSSQFIRAGLKVPHLAVATTSISLIKTLVRSGQFVSWLMEPMFREENERGVLRAVEVGGLSHTLQMRVLRRRDGRLSLPAKKPSRVGVKGSVPFIKGKRPLYIPLCPFPSWGRNIDAPLIRGSEKQISF